MKTKNKKREENRVDCRNVFIKALTAFVLLVFAHAPYAGAQTEGDQLDVSVYGRFWPRLTFKDEKGAGSSTDITDALSRVGVRASSGFGDGWTGILVGEWDVDLEANGDFGDARKAYAAIKNDRLGMIAIGKQDDPHYNMIAAPVDVFYHRSSPLGYDNEGPFRTNNLFTYTFSSDGEGLAFQAGFQANGNLKGDGPSENFFRNNADVSGGSDNLDAMVVGASYQHSMFSIGLSYLRQEFDGFYGEGVSEVTLGTIGNRDRTRNFFGVAASIKPTDSVYLAVAFQNIGHESYNNYIDEKGTPNNPIDDELTSDKTDQTRRTVDVVFGWDFMPGYTALAGWFYYDDDVEGSDSGKLQGTNLTFVKTLNDHVKVFTEWVRTDYSEKKADTFNTFSFGIRFDFNVRIM